MAWKNYTAEQIIGMLREAEVRLSQGEKTGSICRGLGIGAELLPLAPRVWRLEGNASSATEGVGEGECPTQEGGLQPDAGCLDSE